MLQEVLLSLSGHPSPLLDPVNSESNNKLSNISPAELELLKKVGRLSTLNRLIRSQSQQILQRHDAPICQAVATAILNQHLAKFQSKVIQVEESILRKDINLVGAYNIVPLASIVGEFEEWPRLLEWLYKLTVYILPADQRRSSATGAQLINKLTAESLTGYPDISEASIQLSKVAELAWLKQLSNWLLFGQFPYASHDFLVEITDEDTQAFSVNEFKTPIFVSAEIASSILYIGKSIRQTHERIDTMDTALIPEHQRVLSSIDLPINKIALSDAVGKIRSSLSKNVLQKLLPQEKVLQLMTLLKGYFLLAHGEFAVCLIREANSRITARLKQSSVTDSIKSFSIKSGEASTILRKTWTSLSALIDENDEALDELEFAREFVHLAPGKAPGEAKDSKQKTVSFNDFLLPSPIHLSLSISAPYDLFITSSQVKQYSDINMYLLAIRRANINLADLWKQSTLRKEHPTPRTWITTGARMISDQRARRHKRFIEMRKVWATSSASLFLLSELGEYFEGQVIPSLWSSLQAWIHSSRAAPRPSSNPASTPPPLTPPPPPPQQQSHDPESLATAHQAFLTQLAHDTLVHDHSFPTHLHAHLRAVDDLIAQVLRLQRIQATLDLEEDEGIFDEDDDSSNNRNSNSNRRELHDCETELDRARKRVDAGARAVVARLREIGDAGGTVVLPDRDLEIFPLGAGARLEYLLMKLDFGRGGMGGLGAVGDS